MDDKSRCVGFYEKWGCLKINEASLYDAQRSGATERAFLFEKRI